MKSYRTVRILHLNKGSLILSVDVRTIFPPAVENPHIRSDAPVCILQLQIRALSGAQPLFILVFCFRLRFLAPAFIFQVVELGQQRRGDVDTGVDEVAPFDGVVTARDGEKIGRLEVGWDWWVDRGGRRARFWF